MLLSKSLPAAADTSAITGIAVDVSAVACQTALHFHTGIQQFPTVIDVNENDGLYLMIGRSEMTS